MHDTAAAPAKHVLYVVGCGRSGSTILGFCLGNAMGAVDLGEVIDFAKFGGRPNGFDADTDNFRFWQTVLSRVGEDARWPGLEAFLGLQRRFDRHLALPLLLLGSLLDRWGLKAYRDALAALYGAIFATSTAHTCIDSSKYPSRLWHLSRVLPPGQLRVIHLVRDPCSVITAFNDGQQGRPRSAIATLLYYVYVNLMAKGVIAGCRLKLTARLRFDAFAREPIAELQTLEHRLSFDLSAVRERIASGLPLRRGYIMNGNRMRVKPEIVFQPVVREEGPGCRTLGALLRWVA